jgi:hypothetical protein
MVSQITCLFLHNYGKQINPTSCDNLYTKILQILTSIVGYDLTKVGCVHFMDHYMNKK